YATLYALTAALFIGFGAIAVDISMLRLADAEIQAVADAAAQASVLELRRSDSRAVAGEVAIDIAKRNRVAGVIPARDNITFGVYELGSFAPTSLKANAVRVDITSDIRLPFASFWGDGVRTLRRSATAAARQLHTIVVVDITNSWNINDFLNARDGVLAVFDQVTAAAGRNDRIGAVIFYGKYGIEYTPLMLVSDAIDVGVRDDWDLIRPAHLEGQCPNGAKCNPWMPNQYPDETGTDHAIGVQMASKMFGEFPDPAVYRAMIVVTDGSPANVGKHEDRGEAGDLGESQTSAQQGKSAATLVAEGAKVPTSEAWRYEYTGETARSIPEIRTETVAITANAWDIAEVHTWFVSYIKDEQFMRDSAQGDGYFIRTNNSGDLELIFTDIAESLPVTLVE
ncbi:MAG: TadG family pilus assembly protein, partial [Myxococcota bacterium]